MQNVFYVSVGGGLYVCMKHMHTKMYTIHVVVGVAERTPRDTRERHVFSILIGTHTHTHARSRAHFPSRFPPQARAVASGEAARADVIL